MQGSNLGRLVDAKVFAGWYDPYAGSANVPECGVEPSLGVPHTRLACRLPDLFEERDMFLDMENANLTLTYADTTADPYVTHLDPSYYLADVNMYRGAPVVVSYECEGMPGAPAGCPLTGGVLTLTGYSFGPRTVDGMWGSTSLGVSIDGVRTGWGEDGVAVAAVVR